MWITLETASAAKALETATPWRQRASRRPAEGEPKQHRPGARSGVRPWTCDWNCDEAAAPPAGRSADGRPLPRPRPAARSCTRCHRPPARNAHAGRAPPARARGAQRVCDSTTAPARAGVARPPSALPSGRVIRLSRVALTMLDLPPVVTWRIAYRRWNRKFRRIPVRSRPQLFAFNRLGPGGSFASGDAR